VERRVAYMTLVRKTGRKRPIGRPRRRCEDIIKIRLPVAGCGFELE
jgi:hypothetical protein